MSLRFQITSCRLACFRPSQCDLLLLLVLAIILFSCLCSPKIIWKFTLSLETCIATKKRAKHRLSGQGRTFNHTCRGRQRYCECITCVDGAIISQVYFLQLSPNVYEYFGRSAPLCDEESGNLTKFYSHSGKSTAFVMSTTALLDVIRNL